MFYRRKVFFCEKRREIEKILWQLREWKDVKVIAVEASSDNHLFIEISPKMSMSSFIGLLKGKSGLMIYEKWGNL